ncbi:MAG: NAD-dependent epimerase/dehydratase family protein, partial [Chitinophagaceae bacterium]|nr:NAD-dependent epimerase/dehydratase family protein [Chitinophagaceae bacterium]
IHLAGKAHDLKNVVDFNEYYESNTELTKKVYDAFLKSNARVFIFLSSVKAVADRIDVDLTEEYTPNPSTHYGKSKLLAEQYILGKQITTYKRVYILRASMIHGPGNKGNLTLLYNFVKSGTPWPLGLFDNKRSFLSIDNLCFIIFELIKNNKIPSGVYNVTDDVPLSTNKIIYLISSTLSKKPFILLIPKYIIKIIAKLGDIFKLPLNTERLLKLTDFYVISNTKIKSVIKKELPFSSKEGMIKTFRSFNN